MTKHLAAGLRGQYIAKPSNNQDDALGESKQDEENVGMKRSPFKPKPLHELRKNFMEKSLSSKEPSVNGLDGSDIEEEASLIESQLDEIWNDDDSM